MPAPSTQSAATLPKGPRPAGSLVRVLLTGEAALLAGEASQPGGYSHATAVRPPTSSILIAAQSSRPPPRRRAARSPFSLVETMCRLTAAPSLRLELSSTDQSIRSTAVRLLTALFHAVRSNVTSSVAGRPHRFHHPLLAQGS